jgi:hypothetical protein
MAAVGTTNLSSTSLDAMESQGSAHFPDDPFSSPPPKLEHRKSSHRFSAFDTQIFASYQPTASPASAKRALEAHLTETDRRLEEASKLGTALIEQRQNLAERLKEIEQHQDDQEIGDELRQKLTNVEKEYIELGRESARAFLAHKSRGPTLEDGATGLMPGSPTKFSSQATDSPSKLSVPSRKQRNQTSNRVEDIEFVTEISTSLLSQVRQLQALLVERDESIKAANLEKSRIEMEKEGLVQRLRTLDESEQRYKDENWSLETQTHELIAAAKESATKEQKLQQLLAVTTSQKNAAQRELDDVRQAHGKINDELVAFKKAHDSESTGLRKNITVMESERDNLQKKIEELTSQNQELAKAVAGRFRQENEAFPTELGSEPEEFSLDRSDTEHSPPPSPSKGAVRNSMLESETLKSSLHHAHRMIQNLKSSIHREKTEKLELKRMLQETRDELEQRRTESSSSSAKRSKSKPLPDLAKKESRLGQLGAGRQARTEVEIEDSDWVDQQHDEVATPRARPGVVRTETQNTDLSDVYQTATEASDSFETANERETETETEAFQTGNEELDHDSSGDLTETESGVDRSATVKGKQPSPLPPNTKRMSFVSTASTSDDEYVPEVKTPVQQPMKYRMKLGRGNRRSRFGSEEPTSSPAGMRDSPASMISNGNVKNQSLFAELGGLEDPSDDEIDVTPAKSINTSLLPTPSKSQTQPFQNFAPQPIMISSGMMTDPWEPEIPQRPLTAYVANPSVIETPKEQQSPESLSTVTDEPDPLIKASDTTIISDEPVNTMVESVATIKHAPIPEVVAATPPEVAPQVADVHSDIQPEVSKLEILNFSGISSIDIKPSKRPVIQPEVELARPSTAIQTQQPASETSTPLHKGENAAKAGVLGSVLGWAIGKKQSTSGIAEDEEVATSKQSDVASETRTPMKEVSPNISSLKSTPAQSTPKVVEKVDTGAQTMLSATQIDKLLEEKIAKSDPAPAPVPAPIVIVGQTKSDVPPNKNVSQPSPALSSNSNTVRDIPIPSKSVRRPGSASSFRPSSADVPPLPANHHQAIAAAQQAPSKERPDSRTDGAMGPPLMPASAYRPTSKRAQTPSEQALASPSSVTPKPRYSTARSSRSRRSSLSSFESELDTRFNIRADGLPTGQGFDNSTDPRMIQAITQTMIGEFLWKYTRKAGRGEMSDKRHRRFFWVHPYTRTLYWSDQDPSTAGRAQLKAKSVAIEAVRVVADDNPMPPGLHRKSLIIIAPGREVKLTAATGQRHETWFNALSYLLLRSNPEGQATEPGTLTAEDIMDFNPSLPRPVGSRTSLSSYNSRTNTTRRSMTSNRTSSPITKSPSKRIIGTSQARGSLRNSQLNHASIGSRISGYWKPNRASTLTNRDSATNAVGESIYNASVVNDSAEDVRQVLERQDKESDTLENVRACCDGKLFFQNVVICILK